MPEDKRMLFIKNKKILENPKIKRYETEYEVILE